MKSSQISYEKILYYYYIYFFKNKSNIYNNINFQWQEKELHVPKQFKYGSKITQEKVLLRLKM